MRPEYVDAERVAAISLETAMAALAAAAVDRAPDPHRLNLPVGNGALLVMPSVRAGVAGVKLVSVGLSSAARVQGVYALFDHDGRVRWLLDAAALTAVRTAALSALVVTRTGRDCTRLALFGTGVQALAHARALAQTTGVAEMICIGRDAGKSRRFAELVAQETGLQAACGRGPDVSDADLVVTATTSATPVFDGRSLRPDATVVSVGVHEPGVREVDAATIHRSALVVEDPSVARRECGNLLLAEAEGTRPALMTDLVTFLEDPSVVSRHPGPVLFSSSGMAWEDLAVARLVVRDL